MRSPTLRCALAIVLIPLLVLSVFGGAAFLIHAHHDHGIHVHAAEAEAGRFSAAKNVAVHKPESESRDRADPADPDSEPTLPERLCNPEGLLVIIPDQDLSGVRAVTAASLLSDIQHFTAVVVLCWIPPDIVDDVGSPGGTCTRGPRHLCALTAGQRILRTNQALLI